MNRRGFIGRLFAGLGALLVGTKAVATPSARQWTSGDVTDQYVKQARETMLRPPWIERIEEPGGYLLHGRLDISKPLSSFGIPIVKPDDGCIAYESRYSSTGCFLNADGLTTTQYLDFEIRYVRVFGA